MGVLGLTHSEVIVIPADERLQITQSRLHDSTRGRWWSPVTARSTPAAKHTLGVCTGAFALSRTVPTFLFFNK